jgi:hypothetical protein
MCRRLWPAVKDIQAAVARAIRAAAVRGIRAAAGRVRAA